MNYVNLQILLAASAGVAGGIFIETLSSNRKEVKNNKARLDSFFKHQTEKAHLLRENEIMKARMNFALFTADKILSVTPADTFSEVAEVIHDHYVTTKIHIDNL